ncbi:hypothetical protein Tco_0494549 [Tanacetum coccineum]
MYNDSISTHPLHTLHFLKVPENSLELLKVIENKFELLKVLENNLKSLKVLENNLESLKLQENRLVDGLVQRYHLDSSVEHLMYNDSITTHLFNFSCKRCHLDSSVEHLMYNDIISTHASPAGGGAPECQDDREGTPPLTKEQIEGHISAMKSIIKDHNKRNKANPIRLNFEIEDQDPNEGRIVKGKEVDDGDLSKPFKETLRTPFTRRIIEFSSPEHIMPTNITLYDGTTDPADHLNRFVRAANSGEWPMPACYKEPHEITKIVRKANETLTAFKERWTVETGYIIGVPKVMKILSFMDSVKSPKLAKRFASNVPKTVDEMMKCLDEFIRAEEAYALAELPAGESRDIHRRLSFPAGSRDVHQRLTFPASRRDDRDGRSNQGKYFRKGDYRNSYKARDNFNTGRHRDHRAPYPQREQASRTVPKATGNHFGIGKAVSSDERPEAEGGKETKQKPSNAEGEVAKPLGKIDLEVCFGNEGLSRRTAMKFIVIRAPSPYNVILGRPGLKVLHAIPSTIHSMIKFPTPKGIATLITRTTIIAECRLREGKQMVREETPQEEEGTDATE